jgi:signal transduction histidine kinase
MVRWPVSAPSHGPDGGLYCSPVTATNRIDTVELVNDSPGLELGGGRLSTTVAMSIAAVGAALIAIFGEADPTSWITVLFALVGLVPWALEASGARLAPWVFMAMTMVPAAPVVLLDGNPGGLFPVLIAVVWITYRRSSQLVVVAGLGTAVALTIGCGIAEPDEFEGTVYFMGGIGVAWLAGALLHRQEGLLAELRDASERQRAHAAVEERARIARELHDVIAHSLTVTILHVTGARRALTNHPQRAAEALERAEAVGRESLDSIRQVVGLLRGPGEAAVVSERSDDAPLPQIADIPSLIAQYRHAGLHIEASVTLDGITAGAMASLTIFRLVQEAMTNALRHAPGEPVSLSIRPDENRTVVRITVENPIRGATARRRPGGQQGLGLTGMTERVRTAGGWIEVGPTPLGVWRIEAEVPLDLVREPG